MQARRRKCLTEDMKTPMGLIPYEIEVMKVIMPNKLKLFGSVGHG